MAMVLCCVVSIEFHLGREEEFPIEFVNLIKTRGQCSLLCKFNFDPLPKAVVGVPGRSGIIDRPTEPMKTELYEEE